MADEARTPVAIRISRPFATEDEFLRHELETLTRTTVVLVGAQSRPQGVVLRFEVALASGDVLMRGEGRVVGFRPASHGLDSGLTLRFTRLDARSKALVDRAAVMRETTRASLHPPKPPVAEAAPPIPPPARVPAPPPPPAMDEAASTAELPPSSERTRIQASPLMAPPPPPASGTIERARRDELLDRLRVRAKALSPTAVESLLATRARRARAQ